MKCAAFFSHKPISPAIVIVATSGKAGSGYGGAAGEGFHVSKGYGHILKGWV